MISEVVVSNQRKLSRTAHVCMACTSGRSRLVHLPFRLHASMGAKCLSQGFKRAPAHAERWAHFCTRSCRPDCSADDVLVMLVF